MEATPEHRIPPSLSPGLSNGTSSTKPVKRAKMFIVRSGRAQTLCPCAAENMASPPKSTSFKRKSISPVSPAARVIRKRFVHKTTQTGEENTTLNPVQSDRVTESTMNYENHDVYVASQNASKAEYKSTASQTQEFDMQPRIAVAKLSDKQPDKQYVVVKSGTSKPTIRKVRSRRGAGTAEPTTVQNLLNTVKLIRTDAAKEAGRDPPFKEPVATSPEANTVKVFRKRMARKTVTLPEPLPQPIRTEGVQKHKTLKQQATKKHVTETSQRMCLVPGCHTELKLPRPPGMRYHCLPMDPRSRKEYIRACGRNTKISVTGFVCGKHFKRDDYETNGRLKKEARPSVNMQNHAVASTPPLHTPPRRTEISWDELVSPSFRPPYATSDDCSHWSVCPNPENCIQFVRLRHQPVTTDQYNLPYSLVDMIQIFRDLSVGLWTDDRPIPVDLYLNKLTENAQGNMSAAELKKLFRFDFAGCGSPSETGTTVTG